MDRSDRWCLHQLIPTRVEVATSGWWTVFTHPFDFTQYTLANYQRVLTSEDMFEAFVNSLIVTIPATVIPITLAAFAAYAFAWTRFRGRSFLFAVVVGLVGDPAPDVAGPLLRLYGDYDLTGTFVGVWLAHAGFGLPLAIYLLYNYISQLPKDIFESAYIDGATPFTAFTKLVIPLSYPPLPPSPSSSSSGSGTTCWCRWSSSAPTLMSR